MKRSFKSLISGMCIISLSVSMLSCKKMFDLQPEDALPSELAFQNIYDADAAIIGIYGKFAKLSGRYMVLNELRGDLEDVTVNADKYLKEISEHSVSVDNPWVNPKPWYEIIINCNDALYNYDIMLKNKRLSESEYQIRYSEVGAIRTFIYLQLGIHYGSVPYVTDPLISISDLSDSSRFPFLSFDELLTKLLTYAESLPAKNPVPVGNSLRTTLDTYNTEKILINKYMLLGDLNLWSGKYATAASYYKTLMEYGSVIDPVGISAEFYGSFNVGGNPHDLANDNWARIFSQGYSERIQNRENFWMIPFDIKFSPQNPLIELYGPEVQNYKIKPSQFAIKNWIKQTRANTTDAALNGQPVDIFRGNNSYSLVNGNYRINKLFPSYNSSDPYTTSNGKWILYRTGMLHLRMAETANRDGRDKLAFALVNNGIRSAYTPKKLPLQADVTDIMTSKDSNPDYVFYARQGEAPRYRDKYSYNVGVRGRVGLLPVIVDSALYFNMSDKGSETKPVTNRSGLTLAMEDIIANEAALELAFEGNRWSDLLRIARRREINGENGKLWLRNMVARKYTEAGLAVPKGVEDLASGVPMVNGDLKSGLKSWYLPFRWQ